MDQIANKEIARLLKEEQSYYLRMSKGNHNSKPRKSIMNRIEKTQNNWQGTIHQMMNRASLFRKSFGNSQPLKPQLDIGLDSFKKRLNPHSSENGGIFCTVEMEIFKKRGENGLKREVQLFKSEITQGKDPEFNENFQIGFLADEDENGLSVETLSKKLGNLKLGIFRSSEEGDSPSETLRTGQLGNFSTPNKTSEGYLGFCEKNIFHLFH